MGKDPTKMPMPWTHPPLNLESINVEPSGPLLASSMSCKSFRERSFLYQSHFPCERTVPMQSMIAVRDIVAGKEITAFSYKPGVSRPWSLCMRIEIDKP